MQKLSDLHSNQRCSIEKVFIMSRSANKSLHPIEQQIAQALKWDRKCPDSKRGRQNNRPVIRMTSKKSTIQNEAQNYKFSQRCLNKLARTDMRTRTMDLGFISRKKIGLKANHNVTDFGKWVVII
jgi:hypothetical protein